MRQTFFWDMFDFRRIFSDFAETQLKAFQFFLRGTKHTGPMETLKGMGQGHQKKTAKTNAAVACKTAILQACGGVVDKWVRKLGDFDYLCDLLVYLLAMVSGSSRNSRHWTLFQLWTSFLNGLASKAPLTLNCRCWHLLAIPAAFFILNAASICLLVCCLESFRNCLYDEIMFNSVLAWTQHWWKRKEKTTSASLWLLWRVRTRSRPLLVPSRRIQSPQLPPGLRRPFARNPRSLRVLWAMWWRSWRLLKPTRRLARRWSLRGLMIRWLSFRDLYSGIPLLSHLPSCLSFLPEKEACIIENRVRDEDINRQ